jgi:hypothetical protein
MFQNFLFFSSEPPQKLLSAQCVNSLRFPSHHIVLSLERNNREHYIEKQGTGRVEIV